MKNEKRKVAIAKLNQEIQKHLSALQQLLLLEADILLSNGNYIPKAAVPYIDLDKLHTDKENLLLTISDLTTVCQALERGKTNVFIRGTADNSGYILIETCNSMEAAGLSWDGDEFSCRIWFD